jgi:(3,5-dihydroxyphenyl)acetyl-CoA 1,2-dioxygenase
VTLIQHSTDQALAEVRRHLDEAPPFTGSYREDGPRLRSYLTAERETLARLPPRPDRDPGQEAGVGSLTAAGLRLRQKFLRRHAAAVYDELTEGRILALRLDELAAGAAELLPGSVPTPAELAAEHRLAQVHKEGRERELGVLFWSFLRSASAGPHLQHAMAQPTATAIAALPAFRKEGFADLGVATVRRRDGVGEVTLRNLRFLNAEDDAAVEALENAVDLVLLDDTVCVGVLRGAAMQHPRYQGRRVFSAGINLTELYQGRISLLGFLLRRELGYISKLAGGLAAPLEEHGDEPVAEKPWLGVVDTFAIGGGAQIALVLDHVLAERDAYFSLPALREGIIPGVANLRLPRAVGSRAARNLIFSGRRIDAASPDGKMFCDEVSDTEHLDRRALAATSRLANPAVVANRRMLRRAEEPAATLRAYLADYSLEQSRRLFSPDLITNLQQTWIDRRKSEPEEIV